MAPSEGPWRTGDIPLVYRRGDFASRRRARWALSSLHMGRRPFGAPRSSGSAVDPASAEGGDGRGAPLPLGAPPTTATDPRTGHDVDVSPDSSDRTPYKLQTSKLPPQAAGLAAVAFYALFKIGSALPGAWVLYALSILAVIALGAALVSRTAIDVGLDGVLIRRTLSKRFIAHDDIDRVEHVLPLGREWHRLQLHLRSGEVVTLKTDSQDVSPSESRAATIVRDLERARARHRNSKSHTLALVSAGGRDAATWLAALQDLSTGGRGAYRCRIVPPEDLEELLDDAGTPLDARVGAALALEQATGRGRDRLRIHAEGVADQTSHKRLLRIADAEAAELEAHLEELLETEQRRATAGRL